MRKRTTQRPVIAALACLLAVTLPTGAFAVDAPHFERPLPLVQLTDLALHNNPVTRIAWMRLS